MSQFVWRHGGLISRIQLGELLSWIQEKLQRILCFKGVCDFILGHIHSHPGCMWVAGPQVEVVKRKEHPWTSGVGLHSQGVHGKRVEAETKPWLLLPTAYWICSQGLAVGLHTGYRVVELIHVTVALQRIFCSCVTKPVPSLESPVTSVMPCKCVCPSPARSNNHARTTVYS